MPRWKSGELPQAKRPGPRHVRLDLPDADYRAFAQYAAEYKVRIGFLARLVVVQSAVWFIKDEEKKQPP